MDKTNSNATKCSSKSWSHNRSADAETIEKETSQKGKGNTRSVERPKSPMKQRFRSAELDNKDTVSEPGSPYFSIRALSEQDRDKFKPLQSKGGDMAARLLPAKP
ncbi:uncharacterized protein LOC106707437 isoform X2 [Papilio machaon]|uniref:uncharacterized protein LOC106707437 isoform X2 n=1 Tax=Papilio machaon TaxID=76193 RepID=UPI001E664195|nr:uncharacterized protein LOC106707437 isoform X2 [Papilio machaon]